MDGRALKGKRVKGSIAKFMKKFQCFPYSDAPILNFSDKNTLIKPKMRSGAVDLRSRLKLNFEAP